MLLPLRKKPPVQYVRCEMEGCGTVLAHPRYLQVCVCDHIFHSENLLQAIFIFKHVYSKGILCVYMYVCEFPA